MLTVMKAKALLATSYLVSVLPLLAQESQSNFDLFAPVQATREWKPHPGRWEKLLSEKRAEPAVSVGRAEIVVRGPLVETFRRPKSSSELNLGQKILTFPVINLFVPLEMPKPPGGPGKYFAWHESSMPWTAIAAGGSPGEVRSFGSRHETHHGLISFSR
jgi:hypothetical protein